MQKLNDICKINMGQSPKSSSYNIKNDGLPFYQGNADFGDINPNTRYWCNKPTKIAEKNDVLLSVRAPIGAVNIATEKCCIGRGLASIKEIEEVSYHKYLYYFLISRNMRLNSLGTGSTFKAINKSNLENIEIPLPFLPNQQRIAAELDTICGAIAKQKKQLKICDDLIKSKFNEMFGDPVKNDKCWDVKQISNVVDFQGGSQPPKSTFEYEYKDGLIRLIQIRDYKTDRFVTYVPSALARKLCVEDDIMIGRYGPPLFQVLKGLKGAYNVALMKAVPVVNINLEFLRFYLSRKELLEYLEGFSQRTAGQDGVDMSKLKSYPIPLPPLALQQQFADFVNQVEQNKTKIKQALSETETLYKALMQKYFGEGGGQ